MKADHRATLLQRQIFSPGLFSVTFHCPELAGAVRAGQFAMVDVPDRIRPYLRRAYSVADADAKAGTVEFLLKTIGRGTAALEDPADGRAGRACSAPSATRSRFRTFRAARAWRSWRAASARRPSRRS